MADAGFNVGANIGFGAAEKLARALGVNPALFDPYLSCHFAIEIEGVFAGGFAECSGLQVETETLEFREGGVNEFIHRFSGPTRHPLLVLKRGMSPIDGLWNWHQKVVEGQVERHNGTLYLLNAWQIPLVWWEFRQALPVKWVGPSLNAMQAAVAFETIELAHQGLGRPRIETAEAGVAGEAFTAAFGSMPFF